MKLGLFSLLQRPDSDREWHQWFAWHPIVDRWLETKVTVIWLETIERRWCESKHDNSGWWEYRPVR